MRHHVRILLVVAFVIGFIGVPVLAGFVTNSEPVRGSVVLQASQGPAVNVTGANRSEITDFTSDPHTVNVTTDDGNITLRSNSGHPYVHVVDYDEGTWTNVSQVNVTVTELQIDPTDKPAVNVSGDTDTLSIRKNMQIADGTVDFVYSGVGGSTTITLRGLPANTTLAAIDANTGEALGGGDTDASGTITMTMPNSKHVVELDDSDGDPELSDPEPEGPQSDFPTQLNVTVTDPDFPEDNVSVTWYHDGTKLGTNYTESNGTVTMPISKPSRGTHNVSVNATDTYDQTTWLNWSYGVPNRIFVRNVTNTSQLLDNQTVTFTFFVEDQTWQRKTDSGNVSLEGLPTMDPIVVTVEAPGNTWEPAYFTRTYIIHDISRQQTVYMLAQKMPDYRTVFILDDKTGDFDPVDSRLLIRRPITDPSGNFLYATVGGGTFGSANEITTHLGQQVRYRLLVENKDGDRRIVGSYVAENADNPKVITLRDIVVDPPEGKAYYGTGWVEDENKSDDKKTLRFTYADPEEKTDELHITIHERGNESNQLDDVDVFSVGDSFSYTRTLTGEDANTTWMIDWQADRGDKTVGESFPVGAKGQTPIPFDPTWLNRFMLVLIPVGAALSSERIATYGALGLVAITGLLMVLGWYDINPVLWIAALVIAVGGHALATATDRGAFG